MITKDCEYKIQKNRYKRRFQSFTKEKNFAENFTKDKIGIIRVKTGLTSG